MNRNIIIERNLKTANIQEGIKVLKSLTDEEMNIVITKHRTAIQTVSLIAQEVEAEIDMNHSINIAIEADLNCL